MLKTDWDGVAGPELGEESRSFCSNPSERRGWLDQGSTEGGGEERLAYGHGLKIETTSLLMDWLWGV